MSDRPSSYRRGTTARPERDLGGKVLRYAAGSGVATVCSQLTFIVVYGPLGVAPGLSSVVAWSAGAVPNYWLNRSWTWRRTGRPALVHELLPYIAIVLATVALATVATSATDALLEGTDVSDGVRVALVAAAFLGVYGVMFLVRFFLLDRLFRRAGGPAPVEGAGPLPARGRA